LKSQLIRTVLYREAESYVSLIPDKQASMHSHRFGTQSKQSSKQPIKRDESIHSKFENRRRAVISLN